MGVYANDNGTLRNFTRAFTNDNGTLRELTEFAVNDNSTLRHCYIAKVDMSDSHTVRSNPAGGAGLASVSLGNAGTYVGTVSPSGSGTFSETWITPTSAAGSNYECRATVTSGVTPSIGTFNTWLSLGTTRSWTRSEGQGAGSSTLTLEIRRASDGVVLDTVTAIILWN